MSLTSLPAVIRIQIWRILLTKPCPVDVIFENKRARRILRETCCASSPDDDEDIGCQYLECLQGMRRPETGPFSSDRWTCVGPKFSIQVLLVCRLIYEEAVDVFYKENKFMLNMSTSTTIEDFPVFDFARIRSLHIQAQDRNGDLHKQNFKKLIERIHLAPEVRLAIMTSFAKQENSVNFVSALQSLGPVKSCNLSLTWVTEPALLATQLMHRQEKGPPVFKFYNKLPEELRYHVLSFTDLVQDFYMWSGKMTFKNECCRSCCETLFGCCCVRSPRSASLSRRGRSKIPSSNFSKDCQCKQDPLPLLRVSPELQRDALRVLFAKSSFRFVGHTSETLTFFQRIEKYLKLLREITLSVNFEDLEDWKAGKFQWDAFVDYVETHLLLPNLSLTIVAGFTIYSDEPLSPSQLQYIRDFYRSLIPGLQKLVAKRLRRFSIRFSQPELKDWKVTYEEEVMGVQDSVALE